MITNGGLDPVDRSDSCLPGQQVMMRSRQAGFELTEAVFSGDERGLSRFIAGTTFGRFSRKN
jgi:hypothetical protein